MNNIENMIREFVIEINDQMASVKLTDTSSLQDSGFSSLDFVKLVLSVELKFEIEFPVEYMRPVYIDSISKIADIVRKVQEGHGDDIHE
jgi:acyl carrier protein